MATRISTPPARAGERALALEPQFSAGLDLTAFAIGMCGISCWLAPAALWFGGLL